MATATKKRTAQVGSQEAYHGGGGGGGFFPDGLYLVEKASYEEYDFQGKAKEPATCLCLLLNPVNANHEKAGEELTQYWPIRLYLDGGTTDEWIEAMKTLSPSKDKKTLEIGHETAELGKKCEMGFFIDKLKAAGFDTEPLSADISKLDGWVFEMGQVDDPYAKAKTGTENSEDNKAPAKKTYPKRVIVVKSIPKQKGKGKVATGTVAGTKKEEAGDGPTAEELLDAFLSEKICTAKNEDKGVPRVTARMGINKYLEDTIKDNPDLADLKKAVNGLFNDDDNLKGFLEAKGWTLTNKNNTIKKEE